MIAQSGCAGGSGSGDGEATASSKDAVAASASACGMITVATSGSPSLRPPLLLVVRLSVRACCAVVNCRTNAAAICWRCVHALAILPPLVSTILAHAVELLQRPLRPLRRIAGGDHLLHGVGCGAAEH